MSDWTARDFGTTVGMIVGWLVIVIGPIAIGYIAADRLAKKRGVSGYVKWPIRMGFGVSMVLLLAQCAGKSRSAQADEFSTHG